MCKVQPPNAPAGRYAKDAFQIDLDAGTVTCPAGQTAGLRQVKDGHIAHFAAACAGCPLAERCTSSPSGRSIHVGVYEQQLARARARQTDPAWKADYTATRPKVERKIGHLMRRRHGGRRARVRGHTKVERRLLAVGCRGEPRQARDARCHPPHRRVGGKYRLSGLPGPQTAPGSHLPSYTAATSHPTVTPTPIAAPHPGRAGRPT